MRSNITEHTPSLICCAQGPCMLAVRASAAVPAAALLYLPLQQSCPTVLGQRPLPDMWAIAGMQQPSLLHG